VAGLIIFRPIIYKWFKFKNKLGDRIWSLCAVSIAAQIVVFPLSAYYFHQFPVYFLVTNLLVVVPVAIIMYTGIVYLLLPQIPVLSKCLGYVLEQTILFMNRILTAMEHFPHISINKIWFTPAEYLLLYVIIIAIFYFLYAKKAWLLKFSLICILILTVCISVDKINALRTNTLAFLNLHKHVGIVMKRGTSAIVLSDLADTDKNYKYSIQPYLDSSGVKQVAVYDLKHDVNSIFAKKHYNLIQFGDKKILLCEGVPSEKGLNGSLKPDYMYITGNDHEAINIIYKKHFQQTLVIDATNSNHTISALQKRADSCRIKYTLLKRNKSLLVVSN
jgi:competence protein ComEC